MEPDKSKGETSRVAFYGGSFDPLHNGHLEVARELTGLFEFDEFVFVPAFHAPHKLRSKPTSPYHRHAMLCLATADDKKLRVSTVELDSPERPYSIETLTKLKREPAYKEIYFVIGADSWEEITTWRRWQEVLTIVNIIVVTRPGFEVGFSHVTPEIRGRIVDVRGQETGDGSPVAETRPSGGSPTEKGKNTIFITDAVNIDISATEIRRLVSLGSDEWEKMVPRCVREYIRKYGLYK